MAFKSLGRVMYGTAEQAHAYCDDNPCPESVDHQRLQHRWLMSTIFAFRHKLHMRPDDAAEVAAARMRREPVPREVEDTIAKVYYGVGNGTAGPSKPKPNPYDRELMLARAALIPEEITHDMLAEWSPECVIDVTPSQFLATIFPTGRVPVVHAVGTYPNSKPIWPVESQFVWETGLEVPDFDEHYASLHGVWFLANTVLPGTARRRTEDVATFGHGVIESDIVPPDLWIRILVQLHIPILALYTSGGSSIHTLYATGATTLEEFKEVDYWVKSQLIPLGACTGTNKVGQLTRLPGFYRAEKSGFQTLLYLNSKPEGTSIYDQ